MTDTKSLLSMSNDNIATIVSTSTNVFHHVVCALYNNGKDYVNQVQFLINSNTLSSLPSNVRSTIFITLHLTRNRTALDELIFSKQCDVRDIVFALKLIDSKRLIRQLETKLDLLEQRHPDLIQFMEHMDNNKPQYNTKFKMKGRKGGRFHKRIDMMMSGDGDTTTISKSQMRKRFQIIRKIRDLRRLLKSTEATLSNTIGYNHNEMDDVTMQEQITDKQSLAVNIAAAQELVTSFGTGSGVSGTLCTKIRRWASQCLTSTHLEYVMLMMPNKSLWKELADIVHFHPNDFADNYCMADIHNDINTNNVDAPVIPSDCFVARVRDFVAKGQNGELTAEETNQEFVSIANRFPQTYQLWSYFRTLNFVQNVPAIWENVVNHIPFGNVIWNFEDFYNVSPKLISQLVLKRLESGDHELACVHRTTARLVDQTTTTVATNSNSDNNNLGGDGESSSTAARVTTFCKLMERILTVRRLGQYNNATRQYTDKIADQLLLIAESKLKNLRSYWSEFAMSKKVVVIGDASSSMSLAIESASIFATLVAVCFDGMLRFYNHALVESPHSKPQNASQALEICHKVRASGCTSPASALCDLVERKAWLDVIVHVTDEFENTRCSKGRSHAESLAELRKINPNLRVVIVTVGNGHPPFRQEMEALGITDYQTVTIDGIRPDVSKLDSLLGKFAAVLGAGGTADGEETDGEVAMEMETIGNGDGDAESEDDEFVVVNS